MPGIWHLNRCFCHLGQLLLDYSILPGRVWFPRVTQHSLSPHLALVANIWVCLLFQAIVSLRGGMVDSFSATSGPCLEPGAGWIFYLINQWEPSKPLGALVLVEGSEHGWLIWRWVSISAEAALSSLAIADSPAVTAAQLWLAYKSLGLTLPTTTQRWSTNNILCQWWSVWLLPQLWTRPHGTPVGP